MELSPLSVALIIHLIIAAFYTLLILTKRSSLTSANILLIALIPVFGLLSALTAEAINFFRKTKAGEFEVDEAAEFEEDIYWKSIKTREESTNIVPLEEALIINDRFTRKKLVMDMLLDDPMKNIDILLLARENNDLDTAHYANTTIAKVQRDFQLQVQELAAAHEAYPLDKKILDEYINTLTHFIESGLSEAYLLKRQRILLDELLDEKIERYGWSKESLNQKINNCLHLKDINGAVAANGILRDHFPDDEDTWINALQISVAGHDSVMLEDTLEEIDRREIDWSISGREMVRTWIAV